MHLILIFKLFQLKLQTVQARNSPLQRVKQQHNSSVCQRSTPSSSKHSSALNLLRVEAGNHQVMKLQRSVRCWFTTTSQGLCILMDAHIHNLPTFLAGCSMDSIFLPMHSTLQPSLVNIYSLN